MSALGQIKKSAEGTSFYKVSKSVLCHFYMEGTAVVNSGASKFVLRHFYNQYKFSQSTGFEPYLTYMKYMLNIYEIFGNVLLMLTWGIS